jgi:hypothetical protein
MVKQFVRLYCHRDENGRIDAFYSGYYSWFYFPKDKEEWANYFDTTWDVLTGNLSGYVFPSAPGR